MAKLILLDQFYVSLLVPRDLPKEQDRKIARVTSRARFRQQLARAVKKVVRSHPELAEVRVFFTA